MKRILLTIAIAALSALLFACTNKSAPTEPDVSDKERAIIELALFDIRDEVDPDKKDDASFLVYIPRRQRGRKLPQGGARTVGKSKAMPCME